MVCAACAYEFIIPELGVGAETQEKIANSLVFFSDL